MNQTSVAYFARHLAKLGVNMVRLHGPMWKADDFRTIDPVLLDRCFYFIAAMKKEGIYTTLSIYFPLWLKLKPGDEFEGYEDKNPFALLFFNPQFQAIYRNWWKTILTTPNPYGGGPLNQEPAVAVAELVNEDSYLFWTFAPYEVVPGAQMRLVEQAFGQWLNGKYGSVDAALGKWGGKSVRGDAPGEGRAGFMNLWEVFHVRNQRAQDTAQFLTNHQREFFARTQAYLKQELGFQGCVYASNWTTADPRTLGPLDKYSNTVCDVMVPAWVFRRAARGCAGEFFDQQGGPV